MRPNQTSHRNQLANSKNMYQTSVRKVLTVCSAGILRSPTAAILLHERYGFNCRPAGAVSEYALIPVSEVLLFWADEVVFMNHENYNDFWNDFSENDSANMIVGDKRFQILGIPDNYDWNNPKLRQQILLAYNPNHVQHGTQGRIEQSLDI